MIRRMFPYLGIALAFVILVSVFASFDLATTLFWPGIVIAGVLGFGTPDLGMLLLFPFNILFYAILSMSIVWIVKQIREADKNDGTQRSRGPSSLSQGSGKEEEE